MLKIITEKEARSSDRGPDELYMISVTLLIDCAPLVRGSSTTDRMKLV